MTKEQLIEIAKAGIPKEYHNQHNLTNPFFLYFRNRYQLYEESNVNIQQIGWHGVGEYRPYLSIKLDIDYLLIETSIEVFNQIPAIKKMIELNLISKI